MNLYGPISPILPDDVSESLRKIILFDPTPIYKKIEINPFKRWQPVSMEVWPSIPGYCACGCGVKLIGRQTRWAGENHGLAMLSIIRIIQGNSDTVRRIMLSYLPEKCVICGRGAYAQEKITEIKLSNGRIYNSYWSQNGIHADHITPVKKGGGGCWLGNYQFLCHKCNLIKGDKVSHPQPNPLPISQLFM